MYFLLHHKVVYRNSNDIQISNLLIIFWKKRHMYKQLKFYIIDAEILQREVLNYTG